MGKGQAMFDGTIPTLDAADLNLLYPTMRRAPPVSVNEEQLDSMLMESTFRIAADEQQARLNARPAPVPARQETTGQQRIADFLAAWGVK
jgi:hypothetical protein